MNRNKKTLFAVLALYLFAGFVVVFIYSKNGSFLSNKDATVSYDFAKPQDVASTGDFTISNVETIRPQEEIEAEEREREEAEARAKVEESLAEQEVKEEAKHYYTYETTNSTTRLRVRVEPSESAKIKGGLQPGAKGYVLEKGDGWSLIMTSRFTGYASNQYLKFTEIPVDELPDNFPEEYK